MPRDKMPSLLLIAGFGDNASMFDGLRDTVLAERFALIPLNLPGFGRPAAGPTTLASLAEFVAGQAHESGAEVIVAHSVASIIASLAARQSDCPLTTILSLEGNLTADDAYFSGTAAEHDTPAAFRAAFLDRLDQMAPGAPEIARYRTQVAKADAQALWELGRDARRFSDRHHPGDVLIEAAETVYVYNPDNCPQPSLNWLDGAELRTVVLETATHWASVDQPEKLAEVLDAVLGGSG